MKSKQPTSLLEQLENEIKEISLNFEKPEVCCDYVQLMELQKQIDQLLFDILNQEFWKSSQ